MSELSLLFYKDLYKATSGLTVECFVLFSLSHFEGGAVGLIHVSGLPVCQTFDLFIHAVYPCFFSYSHTSTVTQTHKEREREKEGSMRKTIMLK